MSEQTHSSETRLQLYYSPLCFFCQKVLAFMKQNSIELELLSTFDSGNASDLLAGGGKSQVPCLRITNGDSEQWMYESDDIVAYLRRSYS